MASVVFLRCFAVLGQLNALFALPGAQMGGHGFVLKIACNLVVIGFNRDGFANEPGRHGIGIAIKTDGEVGVNLG